MRRTVIHSRGRREIRSLGIRAPRIKTCQYYWRLCSQEEVKDDSPTPQRPYVDIEHERGRRITLSLRRKGFTKRQKDVIKARDGRCVGNGRYGPCMGDQPLALCQADHIDPKGPNATRNGQTLCGNCHDWKTAVENGWWKP